MSARMQIKMGIYTYEAGLRIREPEVTVAVDIEVIEAHERLTVVVVQNGFCL